MDGGWSVLSHLSYSPDLTSNHFHVCRSLQNVQNDEKKRILLKIR